MTGERLATVPRESPQTRGSMASAMGVAGGGAAAPHGAENAIRQAVHGPRGECDPDSQVAPSRACSRKVWAVFGQEQALVCS